MHTGKTSWGLCLTSTKVFEEAKDTTLRFQWNSFSYTEYGAIFIPGPEWQEEMEVTFMNSFF